MEQNFNRRIETDLDLNGPHVVISSHPSDATVNTGATQTFTVSASASFPGNDNPDDEGTLTYQWYEYDDGDGFATKLTNQTEGVTFSGTTTATLTLTGISSPDQNGLKYYCVVGYEPADRYPDEEKGTGHPLNGTVTSNSATLTVNPYLVITSQPSSVDREFNVDGNITVTAVLSDSTYSNDIGYQWYRNGSAISDGTVTTTRIERGTVTEIVTDTNEVVTRHNYSFSQSYSGRGDTRTIPSTASNIQIEIAGGGGGKGGTDYPWNGGGDGGNGRQGKFTLSRAAGTTVTMYAGYKGGDGTHGGTSAGGGGGGYGGWAGGGNGGPAGGSGASGGGGGGGGAGGIYHGDGTLMVVAGGGGGGGGESYNAGPETSSIGIGYDYVRNRLGVHDGGKTIAYGDSHGNDWNATLKITSGDAKFLSDEKIGGSGSTNLYYSWADNPRRAGRANTFIRFGTGEVIEHTYNRAGSASVTLNLGSGSGNKDAGGWDSRGSTFYADGGHGGHPCECSDGAGGGGGGAGAVTSSGAGAGTGGAGGCDNTKGGFNGAGGQSFYRSDYASLSSSSSNSGSGYVSLSYDWYEDETTTVVTYREVEKEIENSIPQNITFSGTRGSTLTVKADYETVENLHCVVSSPQSSNSPLTTNTVQFSSFSNIAQKNLYMEQAFWKFDQWRGGYATGNITAILTNNNLVNDEVTLGYDDGSSGSNSGINIFTSFYVTSDTEIEIDLHGGRGVAWTPLVSNQGLSAQAINVGGGGYGRIRFTMKANREYTVAGMFGTINTPYLYEKDEIIACVGQGGGNNTSGSGGGGGGLNLAGQSGGGGTGNGGGGVAIVATGGSTNHNVIQEIGILGSAYYDAANISSSSMISHIESNGDEYIRSTERWGGRVKQYSRSINNNRNVGTRQMLVRQVNGAASGLSEGTTILNTATIERGFWDIDYAFLGTAGGRGIPQGAPADDPTNNNGQNTTCVGGNGAYGGTGGYNGSAGGGGSGYLNLNKDITLVTTNTGTMGGGTEDAKIVIRLAT